MSFLSFTHRKTILVLTIALVTLTFSFSSWGAQAGRLLFSGKMTAKPSLRATATAGKGVAAFQTATEGQLIISEFRLRGPNGANDEFIEIYNNSGVDHTVMAASGTGYGIAASNGVTRCSIPNGTVIPNRGHYLCVNSVGYSLASYPAGNGTTATGDATYTTDIPDNAGIAIFNNNTGGASYSLANRLDAVGSTSEANTLYKEGTGYPALTPFSIDYSFYRRVPGITGIITGTSVATGTDPVDSNNNAADYIFVDTNGTSAGAGQRLGAPGPQNLSSALPLGNNQLALLDPCTTAGSQPNKVRDFTSDPANNSTFGTIDLRRTFTNNTGGNLTRLRFRIQDLTTFPAPSGVADLRPRTSSAVVVTVDRAPCGSGTSNVTVQGTQLEQPPSQPNGGGFNSSWSAGVVTLATPLANGASIDLRFLFGIQQTGFYRLGITMEGAPAVGGLWVLCGNTETSSDVEGGCIASSVNVTGTGGDDTLIVTATGANSGSYSFNGGAAVAFSGIPSFTFDGMGGNDTLTINNPAGGLFAPSGGIDYNGGGQAGDKLEMLGGLAGSETYFVGTTSPPIGAGPGNNGSGLIRFTGPNLDLRFTGLAPIVDTVAAASLTVNATDAANTINITNATTAPRLQIAVDAFEPIEFNNKTNVFVNGGDGAVGGDVADIINITASNVPAALTTLTINGNEGADTVNALGKSGAYALNINGGADDDTLMGSAGNETFDGGAGSDTFVGNGGTDNIGAGVPDASGDTILALGTAGADTITLALSSGNLLVTINGVTTTYGNFVGGAIATSGIDLVSVNADASADTVNINSTEAGIPTAVNTNAGIDTVNVTSTNATGALTINTGSELDVVNIGNTGAVGSPGLLTPVAGAVSVDGGAGGASLTVDGSGAGVVADYAITSTTVTRSTPAGFGGVTYTNLAMLLLTTGSGANIISVNSTAAGVPTTVNTNAGTDTVNVASTNATGPLNINTGADLDAINVGNTGAVGAPGLLTPVAGAVSVDGGANGASLTVDGSGAGVAADYSISSTTVTRSVPAGFGGMAYTNLASLLLATGAGANVISVSSTAAGVPTNITTSAGNDTIALANGVSLNGGTVDGGTDTDVLDYSAFTTPAAVNLGLGTTGLSGSLDGLQEVPPQSTTIAAGTATISNYNATAKTFDISVAVTDLNPAAVTGFHIHRAPVGTNGPVIVNLQPLAALVPAGTGFTFTAVGVTLPTEHESAFLGGITYVNVHTAAAPGGLIRGQIFSNANVNLASGTATGTNSITNIENVTGGSGNDSLVGSFAANVLQGNPGNDTIVGGPGADTMAGGDNNDVLVWSNGDGSDVMDGQAGADVVQVNGSLTANDVFTIGANGTRVAFARVSPGPFTLDIGSTETLITNGIVGDDSMTLNSLAGVASLAEIKLNGLSGNDTFDLAGFPVTPLVVNVLGGVHTTGDTLNVNGSGVAVSDTGAILSAPGSGTVNYAQIETKAFTNATGITITPPAAAAEGNAGATPFTFTVNLSVPSTQVVMVNFATADGTAMVADNDYVATNGTLTFNPGETSKPIIVTVNGDMKFEPNETFTVNLSGATNATITTAQGTGTINNDDNAPPAITAAAALSRQQGSAGTVANIATVSDIETSANNLVVTATTVPAGITITNITNTNGTIAANITADCAATVGANSIVLTVTDAGGAIAQASLTVNVAANTPPTLGTYTATTIDLAQTLSVTPSAAPSDNVSISSVTATASAGFTGTVTVVAATGVVTISNAAPAGNHIITITARDNCNAPTTQTFSLQVKNSFEGDVAPRPDGDGTLSVADWVMAGRFVVALDTPAVGSEFQRADCAPKTTAGDGRISLIDWVQAGRYAAGLDAAVPRGGPTEPLSQLTTATLETPSSPDSAQPREIRVKADNFKRGQANALRLELSAQGDENALAFTLNFDPTQLSFVTASTTVASLTMNVTQANQGRVGIALIRPSGQTFSAGLQELLDVQFIPAGGYTDTTTLIGFSDQIVRREAVEVGARALPQPTFVNGNIAITGQAIASVSAASYVGSNGAAGAIVSSFGIGLSTTTTAAVSGSPLPTALGGTTVKIKDSAGTERMASLFFASPQQINFQIPEDMAGGLAFVTVTNGNGETSTGLLQIASIAPGLFTANANGAGVAAANLVRVTTDQTQRYEDVAEYDPAQQKFVARAIEFGPDLGVNSEQLFLLLYGTGIRGRSALDAVSVTVDGMAVPVEYAGKHSQYVGLDQINLRLPRALQGRGEVSVVVHVEGQKANEIKVRFR